ncbi:pentapeptide repeat-containing protein [Cystobacter fuscus]
MKKKQTWVLASLKGCRFKGNLSDCDFGHWPGYAPGWEHGSIEDCDFTEARLDGCRIMGCNPATVRFPKWPCFTILDPVQNSRALRSATGPDASAASSSTTSPTTPPTPGPSRSTLRPRPSTSTPPRKHSRPSSSSSTASSSDAPSPPRATSSARRAMVDEILSGTTSNLARHGRRMASEFFRMLTF